MADSRTESLKHITKMKSIVDFQKKIILFLLSIVLAFLTTYLLSDGSLDESQTYVLFLLVLSIGLWVTEAVPPFTVGLLILVFLVFSLGNVYSKIDPENAMNAVQKYVQTWSNSVIWLMLGGFFMAQAMNKVGLDRILFKLSILKFGTKPKYVLLGTMLVTAVFSMLMSNTATTAMMIATVVPFTETLSKNEPFSKAMLIGIPTAATLGGMGTIIGSPPNAIAAELLNSHGIVFGFLEWMYVGFPVAIILVFLSWIALSKKYPTAIENINLDFLNNIDVEAHNEVSSAKRKFTLGVLGLTLFLWLTVNIHGIPAAAVSLLPITILTMFQIISGEDVRQLPWDTLMLVAGGLSLGLSIQETCLAQHYVEMIQGDRSNFFFLIVLFSIITVVFSNFISNTATATILIPIGIILSTQNKEIIPLVIGLSASTAMLLPISTPPNAIAFATGKLRQKDFRFIGLFAGLVGTLVITSMLMLIYLI